MARPVVQSRIRSLRDCHTMRPSIASAIRIATTKVARAIRLWVESPSGGVSPQIVEASQIDLRNPEQRAALDGSTHFNPVDIVCGLRDRHGRSYDLHRYVDPATVFIAEKSQDGRPLKALERPGLWNGAMAAWNTVFVEVPDATFAPVKTVLDLLRPEHQS